MSLTNSSADFIKCSAAEKLPEYLRNILRRRIEKNRVWQKNIPKVLGATTSLAGKVISPVGTGIKKTLTFTGDQLYHHPARTIPIATAVGVGGYKGLRSVNTNLRHVDPNQDVTESAIPSIRPFGVTLTSPLPLRSIQYKNKSLDSQYKNKYNLF